MAKNGSNAPTGREKLKSLVDRIVRLEEERKSIADDIKDVYGEAKNDGFDPKAMKEIVKDAMRTPEQRAARREVEALADIYRASLGMLDGTPMGDAARRRYERELRDAQDEARRGDEAGSHSEPAAHEDASEDDPKATPAPTEDEAREQGQSDHAGGKRIVDNPFPAGSRLRAAWDEGWCAADGSDGMDLPKAWRRGDAKSDDRPSA
jgi:uncharacterized protein (UPF0335 family)